MVVVGQYLSLVIYLIGSTRDRNGDLEQEEEEEEEEVISLFLLDDSNDVLDVVGNGDGFI